MSQLEINPDKFTPKSDLKPVLFSILILVSGIIIGSTATLMTVDQFKKQPVPPGPEYMSGRMIERITRELHLSPEQRKQLDPIVKQHMLAIDKIREVVRPKIADELKQMNDEIMAVLNEGQKQIWTDKIQRIQDNFPRMHQRRRTGRTPQDRNDPNFRPDDSRPLHPYHNQPPEDWIRPDMPPSQGTEEMEKSVP